MKKDQNRAVLFKDFDQISASTSMAYIGTIEALFLALSSRGMAAHEATHYVTKILRLPKEMVTHAIEQMVAVLGPAYLSFTNEAAGPPTPPGPYNPRDFIFTTQDIEVRAHFETPVVLVFSLTRVCGRQCIYCYAGANYTRAKIMTVRSPVPWLSLAEEAGDLGVLQVHLTGGEPFLYADILPLVRILVRNGATPFLSTKAYLPPDVCRQLADTGLQEMQVSLDSPFPDLTDRLTGVPGTHDAIIDTIRNLHQVGIRTRVNAVVTSLNVRALPQLITLLGELGVSRLIFAPYTFSLGRHSDDLYISDDDYVFVQNLANTASADLDLGVDAFTRYEISPPTTPATVKPSPYQWKTQLVCAGGMYGFAIGPTGDVAICERLLDVPGASLGNVVTHGGLREFWDSPDVRRFVSPPREAFIGTACESCAIFESCETTLGRCYVRAYDSYGKLFAPDPLCPAVQRSLEVERGDVHSTKDDAGQKGGVVDGPLRVGRTHGPR
jgi:radical SAM protein with 4Fe4S-binding SPASM domain